VEKRPINAIHQLILDEFGTITHAARKLGYTRRSIYDFIDGNMTSLAREKITERGYCPDTFKPVAHVKNN